MRKFFKYFLVFLATTLLGGFIFAWIKLPDLILIPRKTDVHRMTHRFPNGILPSGYQLKYDEFDLTTMDGFKLDGWLTYSTAGVAKGTIILLHGIGSCKEVNLNTAKILAGHGFNTVMFDLRTMGQSEGLYCTFGKQERMDVKQYTDSILKKFPGKPVGIVGTSLGGAIALQCLGTDHRLKFGVIECAYDEMKKVVRSYATRKFGYELDAVADFALWRAEMKGDFEEAEVDPFRFAQQIQCPVMVVHGNQDNNIPIAWGKRNFDEIPVADKLFYEVKGANHNGIHKTGGDKYHNALINFMESHIN